MMASIKGKDTSPELTVRRFLHRQGFRYRLYVRSLPGCPDIVLPKYNAAIFVHGCFWHQHPGCGLAYMPQSNAGFWRKKLEANRKRDIAVEEQLRGAGWRVFIVWQCHVTSGRLLDLSTELKVTSISEWHKPVSGVN
jgi:DNA mismatch endonuclease (patch repair protein)